MIPGITTKLSEGTLSAAATISPKTDIVHLISTGVTIDNIVPAFGGGHSGLCFLVPVGGPIIISNTGNVFQGIGSTVNMIILVYMKRLNKWAIVSGITVI